MKMRIKNFWLTFTILLSLFYGNINAAVSENTAMTHIQPYSYYMKILVKLAKTEPKAPFAAMIVDRHTGKIISEGLNNADYYPILHGEIVAMNNAIKKYPHLNWQQMVLLTTAEPCAMEIYSKVVYG